MSSRQCLGGGGSSSGAIPEVIGDAGLVFEEGNSNALAARLRELLTGAERLAAFRDAGLARARQFSAERFAERLEATLREVVMTGSAG